MKYKLSFHTDFTVDFLEQKAKIYSFLNPASLKVYFAKYNACEITYFFDGMILAKIVSYVTGKKVNRVSFDFTSIANQVFDYVVSEQKKVSIIASSETEVANFINKIKILYPTINIVYYRSGYFESDFDKSIAIRDVINLETDILLVGMGAGNQELFQQKAKTEGFNGISFSCGGFVRQESNCEEQYYPKWIDKFNLRAFYRMYREPHTIKRYLLDYPTSIIEFIIKIYTKKIDLEIK